MSFNDVLRRFKLLSGLEGEKLSRYSFLCSDSINEMNSKLSRSVDSLNDSQKLRLSYAAGALAFYKYCLYSSVTEPESFEAGEVRVTNNKHKAESARRLFEEECKGLSEILKDSGFCFRGVKA